VDDSLGVVFYFWGVAWVEFLVLPERRPGQGACGYVAQRMFRATDEKNSLAACTVSGFNWRLMLCGAMANGIVTGLVALALYSARTAG